MNLDTQKAIIAVLLNHPELHPAITNNITVDDLCNEAGKPPIGDIYRAIKSALQEGRKLDVVLIAQEAGVTRDYLQKFVEWDYSTDNIDEYVQKTKERATTRRLKEFASGLLHRDADSGELMEYAEKTLANIRSLSLGGSDVKKHEIATVVEKYLEKVEKDKTIPIEERVIRTQFTDLNRVIGGLYRSNYSILTGRPGMAKTLLASNITDHRLGQGDRVATFILEMSEFRLLERQISARTGIPIRQITELSFFDDEEAAVSFYETVNTIAEGNWHLYGLRNKDFRTLERNLLSLQYEVGRVDLVTVDYLQKMHYPGPGIVNRPRELGRISSEFATLAGEIGSHFLVLSQLNRECENRQDKRPQLSDLKGSGDIEQDADLVMGLYRDAYYYEDTDRPNVAEVLILKQRNGPFPETVDLYYSGKDLTFGNLEKGTGLF